MKTLAVGLGGAAAAPRSPWPRNMRDLSPPTAAFERVTMVIVAAPKRCGRREDQPAEPSSHRLSKHRATDETSTGRPGRVPACACNARFSTASGQHHEDRPVLHVALRTAQHAHLVALTT